MRRWHWLNFAALLWLVAAITGAVLLWIQTGLVPSEGGDCPKPGPCYMFGHPYVLPGIGLAVVGLVGVVWLWSEGQQRRQA